MNEMEIVRYGHGGARHPINFSEYPDGMPYTYDHDSCLSIISRPTSLARFMAMLFWVDAHVERGNVPPALVLPFVPGARQDRLNTKGDYLFTAKSIAHEINARNFTEVIVVDPHSDVIAGLIDRCRVVHVIPSGEPTDQATLSLGFQLPDYDAVIAPDAGAEKRSQRVADVLGVPVVRAWKHRDVKTGKIDGFGYAQMTVKSIRIHNNYPQPFRMLVVDDICDGGGTFVGLAETIAEDYDVTLDLFVTHGIFSQGVHTLQNYYEDIYTTDSIPFHTTEAGVRGPDHVGVTVAPINYGVL